MKVLTLPWLSGAALVLGLAGATAARADTGPALGGYSLIGRAPGFEITEDEPSAQTHPEGQGTIPETQSQLTTGTAYAFSSVVWPGTLGGNAGSLILGTVGGNTPLPPQVALLNDPVRAEARTGQTQPDVEYTTPAVSMHAHADAARAEGASASAAIAVPGALSTGRVMSDTTSRLGPEGGTVLAASSVSDVNLAGTLVHVGSVTSKATAHTDGASSGGTARTVVSDLTVAGQAATLDDQGLHAGSAREPANEIVNQIVNSALAKAGVTFALGHPSTQTSGASTTVTAGSLVVVWSPPGSKNTFAVTLGGASAVVVASPAFDGGPSSGPPAAPLASSGPNRSPLTGSGGAPTAGPGSPSSGSSGSGSSAPGPLGPVAPGARAGRPHPLAATLAGVRLPGGLPAPWLLVGLGAAGLLASAMARLGTGVLADGDGCSMEMEGEQ